MHAMNMIVFHKEITRMTISFELQCNFFFHFDAKYQSLPFNIPDRISDDLAPIVYCSVIEFGSIEEWKYLWEKFKTSTIATERSIILNALGCTKQTDLMKVDVY